MIDDHLKYMDDMPLQQLVIHSPLVDYLVYSWVWFKFVHPWEYSPQRILYSFIHSTDFLLASLLCRWCCCLRHHCTARKVIPIPHSTLIYPCYIHTFIHACVASPSIPHEIHHPCFYSSTRRLSLSRDGSVTLVATVLLYCKECRFSSPLFIHGTFHQYISLRVHLYSGQHIIHPWTYSSEFVGCQPGIHERVGFGFFVNCPAVTMCVTGRTASSAAFILTWRPFIHDWFHLFVLAHSSTCVVTKIDGPSLVLLFAYLILIEFGRLRILCVHNYDGYWA